VNLTLRNASVSLLAQGAFEQGTIASASNSNVTGVGVFNQINGSDLQFKGINSLNSFLTVQDNLTNKTVDLELKKDLLFTDPTFTGDKVTIGGAGTGVPVLYPILPATSNYDDPITTEISTSNPGNDNVDPYSVTFETPGPPFPDLPWWNVKYTSYFRLYHALSDGATGSIYYSRDGSNFTPCNMPDSVGQVRAIVFNELNNTFLAFRLGNNIGASPSVIQSNDGITWTHKTDGNTQATFVNKNIVDSTWLGGTRNRYIAVSSESPEVIVSTDTTGTNWSVVDIVGSRYDGVAYNPTSDIIVITGRNVTSTQGYIYSSNDGGATWTQRLLVSGVFNRCTYFQKRNRFVAVGNGEKIYWSDDGFTWTQSALGPLAGTLGADIWGITYTSSQFILATSSKIIWSNTGTSSTWVNLPLPPPYDVQNNWFGVAYSPERDEFIAISRNVGNNLIKFDSKGAPWRSFDQDNSFGWVSERSYSDSTGDYIGTTVTTTNTGSKAGEWIQYAFQSSEGPFDQIDISPVTSLISKPNVISLLESSDGVNWFVSIDSYTIVGTTIPLTNTTPRRYWRLVDLELHHTQLLVK
jgi:hypothetical protein